METINPDDLIPVLTDLLERADKEVGDFYEEWDGDMVCLSPDYEENRLIYDDGPWFAEVRYRCCGKWLADPGDAWNPPVRELRYGWGYVSELVVEYVDPDTGDTEGFSDEELKPLLVALNEVLKEIS